MSKNPKLYTLAELKQYGDNCYDSGLRTGTLKKSYPMPPIPKATTQINDIPLDLDKPWPTKDVLKKLIWAAEYLLHEKSYDGHAYEEIEQCVKRGKELIADLNNLAYEDRWIKLSHTNNDILPDTEKLVLVLLKNGHMMSARYDKDNNDWYDRFGVEMGENQSDITHYRSLPKLPY